MSDENTGRTDNTDNGDGGEQIDPALADAVDSAFDGVVLDESGTDSFPVPCAL